MNGKARRIASRNVSKTSPRTRPTGPATKSVKTNHHIIKKMLIHPGHRSERPNMKSTESRTVSRISPRTPQNGSEIKWEVLNDSVMRLIMPMMKAKPRVGVDGDE